jgi:hypothetical protein
MAGDKTGPKRYVTSADQAQRLIDAYFKKCEGIKALDEDGVPIVGKTGYIYVVEPKPLTINGLGLALGYAGRQGLHELIRVLSKEDATAEDKQILDVITRAKSEVENYAETRLFDKDGSNGAKFWLASNGKGWSDKQDITIGDKIIKVTLDDE